MRSDGEGRRAELKIGGLGGVWLRAALVFAALVIPAEALRAGEVHLLAMGDWGGQNMRQQTEVANQMARFAAESKVKLSGVLLAGDNFYTGLDSIHDERWQTIFEEMYDRRRLNVPFYAVLGNHDYQKSKAQVQLEYAQANPRSRWKMPSKWYRLDIPVLNPVVTVLMLDSNKSSLSGEEWAAEKRWMEHEMSKPRRAPWLVCVAHHPLFSSGSHGDSETMQSEFGPLFRRYAVDLYIAGHDHDLQHVEIPGWHTSFVMVGGGGANTRDVTDKHGPFARRTNGFAALDFSDRAVTVRLISARGITLHEFRKRADRSQAPLQR